MVSTIMNPASQQIRCSRRAAPFTLSLHLLLVVFLLVISSTIQSACAVAATTTSSSSSNLAAKNEDRPLMDKAANAALARLGLNTLTTSCNGGCGRNAPCVVVGSSSENRINCVNDTRCATLTNGKAALCMEPFADSDTIWSFFPGKTNNSVGVSPFEQVGLVQPSDAVNHVLFRRASAQFTPLSTALDVSSVNIQPNRIIGNITFDGLELTGVGGALGINAAYQLNVVNCNLKTIPAQMVMGSNTRVLDLSGNALTSTRELQGTVFPSLEKLNLQDNQLVSMDIKAATFPKLTTLLLDGNQLPTIPSFIFNSTTLTTLSVTRNPVNASLLDAKEFEFLANLQYFAIEGMTTTVACPSDETIAKLNTSFLFCFGRDNSASGSGGSGSGSGSDVGDVVVAPKPPPASQVTTPASTSSSKAGLVVGITVGALAVLAILAFIFWWCVRRRTTLPRDTEPHKPTFTSVGSFIAAGGPGPGGKGQQHSLEDYPLEASHYDAFVPLRSNGSSEHSSDSYPILGNIATDGPDGLPRLSYHDLYLHKLMRVSSRSELWLGEYFDDTVVVKKIKTNTVSRAVMRDFVEEVKLMATLKHARIVEFRGALWDKNGSELCAVVEYMENGPLRNVTASKTALSVPKQHAIGRQIAEALAFLHAQQIVHGRLNAFNILLDREFSAKISLFSVFHYVRLSPLDYECAVFVAPELQQGKPPSEKADVFAFGVVLVELDTGESPEQNRRRRLSLQDTSPSPDGVSHSPTAQRTGFSLSAQCSSMMKDLITACVERDPARRPSMAQIAMALRTGEIVM